MRKIHVKVVLDVLVKADESIYNPEDYVVEDILAGSGFGSCGPANDTTAVSIEDVQIVNYEVTDSR